MTPEERQMLADLFDRVRSQASAPRDAEAARFIDGAVKAQPYAPYLLAQTVLVQENALSAAAQQIQELQAQLENLENSGSQAQAGGGSFLGGIGRSLFGGQSPPPRGAVPNYAPQGQYGPPQGQYAPPPNYGPGPGGPWGQQPATGGGGSFLRGALGTAAGVAGGVLLADTVRDLFTQHNPSFASLAGITPEAGGASGAGGGDVAQAGASGGGGGDPAQGGIQSAADTGGGDPAWSSDADLTETDYAGSDYSDDDSYNV